MFRPFCSVSYSACALDSALTPPAVAPPLPPLPPPPPTLCTERPTASVPRVTTTPLLYTEALFPLLPLPPLPPTPTAIPRLPPAAVPTPPPAVPPPPPTLCANTASAPSPRV